jgi:hypothetical protein
MLPLVGVNYNCDGKNWVPLNESIARAVRQVEFVKKAGFTGVFYYIGNEDGASMHAPAIAAHARAMKVADPTLKAFWNDNGLRPAGLQKFLQVRISRFHSAHLQCAVSPDSTLLICNVPHLPIPLYLSATGHR